MTEQYKQDELERGMTSSMEYRSMTCLFNLGKLYWKSLMSHVMDLSVKIYLQFVMKLSIAL